MNEYNSMLGGFLLANFAESAGGAVLIVYLSLGLYFANLALSVVFAMIWFYPEVQWPAMTNYR